MEGIPEKPPPPEVCGLPPFKIDPGLCDEPGRTEPARAFLVDTDPPAC